MESASSRSSLLTPVARCCFSRLSFRLCFTSREAIEGVTESCLREWSRKIDDHSALLITFAKVIIHRQKVADDTESCPLPHSST